MRFERAYARRAVRAAHRRRAAGDQARRAHELLRHRLARRRRRGRVVLVPCIDNLLKGAAGQAVQNFNVVLGLDERTGAAVTERAHAVLKLGGELLEHADGCETRRRGASRAVAPRRPLVVVHGGGKEIDAALARPGIAKRQVDGLRVTDAADARRRRRGARRRDQHAPGGGAERGRRAGRSA